MNIVLYEPQIPPNTGSIARLCAATGTTLHLVGRLGFKIDEKSLRRAGLDYWKHVDKKIYESWDGFLEINSGGSVDNRFRFFSKKGKTLYTDVDYPKEAFLVFGSETAGLPDDILKENLSVKIPINTRFVRSLNLAMSAGIALFEALRQNGFPVEDKTFLS